MLKKLLIILALFVPVVVFAATNDFVANSNITVPGVTFGASTADMVIMSGSESESWTFSSGTFTVANPGSAFQVGSSDASVKSIQVTQSGTTLVCQENTTPGTSAATLPTTAGTYTVSPSATTQCTSLCAALSNVATYNSFPTCGAASCNAGYRLSGSSASATCVPIGGGGVIVPCGVGYQLSAGLCVPVKSTHVTPAPTTLLPSQTTGSAVFIRTMSLGMSADGVRSLQMLLASDKAIYPEGTISGYYGSLTQKAVGRFQAKYGIATPGDSGYGTVGPKTRAKLQELFSGSAGSVSTPATTIASPTNALFTVSLKLGMRSSDVYRLQQLLATDKELYPEGTLSGYFGPLTKEAVQRFQIKYGVVSLAGDAGYGSVGPKTRAKLQEIFRN